MGMVNGSSTGPEKQLRKDKYEQSKINNCSKNPVLSG